MDACSPAYELPTGVHGYSRIGIYARVVSDVSSTRRVGEVEESHAVLPAVGLQIRTVGRVASLV